MSSSLFIWPICAHIHFHSYTMADNDIHTTTSSQVSKKSTFKTSRDFVGALTLWMYSSTGLRPGNSSGLSLRQLSSATFTHESAPSSPKYRPDPRRKVITREPNNLGFANVFTYPETAILRSSDRQSVLHRRRKRSARVTWQRSRRSLATCQIMYCKEFRELYFW